MKNKEFGNRIGDVLGTLQETLERKNADYGCSFSALFDRIGMPYAYGHMSEKLERIWTLMHNNANVDESIDDSLLDLAGYAILTLVCRSAAGSGNTRDLRWPDDFYINAKDDDGKI